jgi:hypothetical protein
VLAWAAGVRRRALVAGLLVGLAASVKQPPIFMLLALLPTAVSRREAAVLVAAAVSVPVASVLPFLALEPRLTLDGLTANRGVPGFGGVSAFVQPELTRAWSTLDARVEASSALRALTDVQNLVVGAAVLVTGALLYRRRVEPLAGAVVVWLVVYATNVNFAFQYLVWGLPFFLAAGHLRAVGAFSVLATAGAFLLLFHPDLGDAGWTYYVVVQAVWLALLAAAAIAVVRVVRGAGAGLTLPP